METGLFAAAKGDPTTGVSAPVAELMVYADTFPSLVGDVEKLPRGVHRQRKRTDAGVNIADEG